VPRPSLGGMTDSLLRSIRHVMLDETEPLAGLLRKCLLLGAETGSTSLREWARRELNGYDGVEEVPDYRKVHDVPISMDSVSGNFWAKGQILSRLNLPKEAWEFVPEEFPFRQPVEELEQLAVTKRLSFSSPGLSYAQMIWNKQLGPFQSIHGLSYVMTGSAIAGILGQIRTQLVDIIADLTADTLLTELPGKEQVDAAITQHIGQIYTTTIEKAEGPVAIGAEASATAEGLSVRDALRLLDDLRAVAEEAVGANVDELLAAVHELREAVEQDEPNTGELVKKAGRLRILADKVGVAAVTAATSSATGVLIEMAASGAFH
jgi:hypothetical protein